MLVKTKILAFNGATGADVTPEMLDKINKFAQNPLAAEDVFIQKYLIAHSGIDRDRERFPEDLLDDFVRTLPGKSFLEVHDKQKLPIGTFFNAEAVEMGSEEFKSLTGESIRLPDGVKTVKVVYGWIYTLKAPFNEKLIANLSAGIYRHVSIGFSATDLKPVKGDLDQVLYYEYAAPGEAREGSIVYLGAQQGATAQKSADGFRGGRDINYETDENPLTPGTKRAEESNLLVPSSRLSCEYDEDLKYDTKYEKQENNPLIPK